MVPRVPGVPRRDLLKTIDKLKKQLLSEHSSKLKDLAVYRDRLDTNRIYYNYRVSFLTKKALLDNNSNDNVAVMEKLEKFLTFDRDVVTKSNEKLTWRLQQSTDREATLKQCMKSFQKSVSELQHPSSPRDADEYPDCNCECDCGQDAGSNC